MARRRNQQTNPFLAVVVLIVAAVAVIGPFFVAGWALFSEVRARRFSHIRNVDQLIPSDARAQLGRFESRLSRIDGEISRLYDRGLSAGLMRRADGLFDARATAARTLNDQLDRLGQQRAMVDLEMSAVKDGLGQKIDVWIRARSQLVGARAGLVVFVVLFVGLICGPLAGLSGPATAAEVLFGGGEGGPNRILASALATAGAGLAMWIGTSINRASISA